MQGKQPAYFTAYRNVKLTRDTQSVLVVEFHSNGGPLAFTASDRTDFVEAFYRISHDRQNKIVILTGAGVEFIPAIDFSSFGNVADPCVWTQVHDEGAQILENLANIRVPMIAAVEGRAHVHPEYALLADVIVAGQGATFNDVPHFAGGIVPGDGIFTTWSYRAGAGRAEAFLLNPQPMTARTAHEWGVVPRLCRTIRQSVGRGSWRRCTLKAGFATKFVQTDGHLPTSTNRGLSVESPKAAEVNAPQHTRAFRSAIKGAHRTRSRLWALSRRRFGSGDG